MREINRAPPLYQNPPIRRWADRTAQNSGRRSIVFDNTHRVR